MKHSTANQIFSVLKKLTEEAHDKEIELLDIAANACDSAKVAAAKVDKSVHAHPWCYVGIAAVVGFIGGFLVRR